MNPVKELHLEIEKHRLWKKKIELKRNEFLSMAGSTETNLYYIDSGSLKISIMDNQEEHIVRFGYKHNIIAALDSFISNNPSEFYIQALKKTTLKVVCKKDFFQLLYSNINVKKLWDDLVLQLILQQLDREKDILIRSPQERYNRVLKRSPQLFQEIPNKYIASYLRMSPETLSRIKKS